MKCTMGGSVVCVLAYVRTMNLATHFLLMHLLCMVPSLCTQHMDTCNVHQAVKQLLLLSMG